MAEIIKEMAFPQAEYDRRQTNVRAAMDRAGLDLLLVHGISNICYLTGFQTPLSDWYHCLILPRNGDPVLQACDTELAAMHTEVESLETVLWPQMDEAPGQLAELLRAFGTGKLRIGLEMRRPGLTPHTERALAQILPQVQFADATDLVPMVRAIKSAAEIAHMREAARFSALGMEAAMAAIEPGATENLIAAAAMQAMVGAGSEYFCIDPIVRAGRRSGVTHATAKRTVIQAGDPVLMEFGGVYQRYCAPLLRSAVIGQPSARYKALADASLRAMDLLFENLEPGRSMGDVAKVAMRAFSDLDPAVQTRGYFGYSVGIGFPPSWVERSVEIADDRADVLHPGMTFHTHRALRVPGHMGAGFSESVVITDTGYERLTNFPRKLFVR